MKEKSKVQKTNNRIKENLLRYKGGKCIVCDYDNCISSLDFHHVNPSSKLFNLSKYSGRSSEEIKLELQKCVVLCKNHHAELHFGLISIESSMHKDCNLEELWVPLKKELITPKKAEPIDRKTKICPQCQGPMFYNAKTCNYCKPKSKKFEISKEELEQLINELPMTKIGEIYGVSDNAIKKRAKKLGIELPNRRGYWAKVYGGKYLGI